MAADPTRTEALRAAGFAATVDTQDPPGKVTVVFDLADFDELIGALVDGNPHDVVTARAEGVAEGRSDAEAVAGMNARRALTVELVAEGRRGTGELLAKVAQLARTYNVPTGPPAPEVPGVRDAMVGDGPAADLKGRVR